MGVGRGLTRSGRLLHRSHSGGARAGYVPLIPMVVAPCETALRAYSIWSSFPDGEKVVRENEYRVPMDMVV